MTRKQLIEYIIKNNLLNQRKSGCPLDAVLDSTLGGHICKDNCSDCWADFLRNRYRNYKG